VAAVVAAAARRRGAAPVRAIVCVSLAVAATWPKLVHGAMRPVEDVDGSPIAGEWARATGLHSASAPARLAPWAPAARARAPSAPVPAWDEVCLQPEERARRQWWDLFRPAPALDVVLEGAAADAALHPSVLLAVMGEREERAFLAARGQLEWQRALVSAMAWTPDERGVPVGCAWRPPPSDGPGRPRHAAHPLPGPLLPTEAEAYRAGSALATAARRAVAEAAAGARAARPPPTPPPAEPLFDGWPAPRAPEHVALLGGPPPVTRLETPPGAGAGAGADDDADDDEDEDEWGCYRRVVLAWADVCAARRDVKPLQDVAAFVKHQQWRANVGVHLVRAGDAAAATRAAAVKAQAVRLSGALAALLAAAGQRLEEAQCVYEQARVALGAARPQATPVADERRARAMEPLGSLGDLVDLHNVSLLEDAVIAPPYTCLGPWSRSLMRDWAGPCNGLIANDGTLETQRAANRLLNMRHRAVIAQRGAWRGARVRLTAWRRGAPFPRPPPARLATVPQRRRRGWCCTRAGTALGSARSTTSAPSSSARAARTTRWRTSATRTSATGASGSHVRTRRQLAPTAPPAPCAHPRAGWRFWPLRVARWRSTTARRQLPRPRRRWARRRLRRPRAELLRGRNPRRCRRCRR
jgi:hypothetical protein